MGTSTLRVTDKTRHIVLYSGGVGSWYAARLVAHKYGTKRLILLFTDTKMEDEDLYRFLHESAKNVGGQLITIADGRTPWDVFFDVKFLGNSRIDPCSRILKREPAKRFVTELFDPDECVVYLGIDWSEDHRYQRAKRFWEPYTVRAPLCSKKVSHLTKKKIIKRLEKLHGITRPRLYQLNFEHNNCSGFCVKAGQGQFKRLYETMPEQYAVHEQKEREIREFLNKDVSIMRRMEKGILRNLTMEEFREELEAKSPVDELDIGGCGCMLDEYSDEEFDRARKTCG